MGCVQYSAPVSYSWDVFREFSDVDGENFHERAFLTVHEKHLNYVHSRLLEASAHAFGGKDVSAVVESVLARLRPFVAASLFADAPSLLQVKLRLRMVFVLMGILVGLNILTNFR